MAATEFLQRDVRVATTKDEIDVVGDLYQYSNTITATGNSTGVHQGRRGTGRFSLVVASIGGTSPSYTVTVQTSHDNATWNTAASFTAVTANGTSYTAAASAIDEYIRFSWTVSGTTPTAVLTISAFMV
jgi:hypothetical protein